MRKLKDPCQNCGKPLDPNWRVCPYCEAEVGTHAPTQRRARRRRDAVPEQAVAQGGSFTAERGTTGAPIERGSTSAT